MADRDITLNHCAAAAASIDSDHVHACRITYTPGGHPAYHGCDQCGHHWPTSRAVLEARDAGYEPPELHVLTLGKVLEELTTLTARVAALEELREELTTLTARVAALDELIRRHSSGAASGFVARLIREHTSGGH